MSLCEVEKNGTYRITRLNLEDANGDRLRSLGGTEVKVISRKKQGSLIIESCGKQIALCKNFASAIDVKESKY